MLMCMCMSTCPTDAGQLDKLQWTDDGQLLSISTTSGMTNVFSASLMFGSCYMYVRTYMYAWSSQSVSRLEC